MEQQAGARPPTARSNLKLVLLGLGAAAGLFLAWQAAGGLFLVFAGLVFAAFLDAGTRGLGYLWAGARGWRLAIFALAIALLVVGGASYGGYTVVQQADELVDTVQQQLRSLRGELSDLQSELRELGPSGDGPDAQEKQSARNPGSGRSSASFEDGASNQESAPMSFARSFLPDPQAVFGSITSAVGLGVGAIGNLVVIAFLGLYLSVNPELYRDGALRLVPQQKRARVGHVLDEAGGTLRWWVLGQLVAMAAVSVLSFTGLLLIGMPWALTLALQAGLFAFIPYLGPFIGGAIIVLAALAEGPVMALWAFGVYALVQAAESYVIEPLVQRRAVSVPPALLVGSLVILGMLFGMWGLALGAPLVAVLRVVVQRLWVEDFLGDIRGEDAPNGKPASAG